MSTCAFKELFARGSSHLADLKASPLKGLEEIFTVHFEARCVRFVAAAIVDFCAARRISPQTVFYFVAVQQKWISLMWISPDGRDHAV
jgi:hypothetical protein